MFTIETQSAGDHTTIQLEGELRGRAVEELAREWRQLESKDMFLQVNLCRVNLIDDAGKKLLRDMFCGGVGLIIGPGAKLRGGDCN